MKILFEQTSKLDDLKNIVCTVRQAIEGRNPFVLTLVGDLGAGKTTFTRAFFQTLGLSPKVPVQSPTFTYLNEYEIAGHWYAHIDLYRLVGEDTADLSSVIPLDYRTYRGFLIEWPNVKGLEEILELQYELTIEYVDDEEFRKYSLRQI